MEHVWKEANYRLGASFCLSGCQAQLFIRCLGHFIEFEFDFAGHNEDDANESQIREGNRRGKGCRERHDGENEER